MYEKCKQCLDLTLSADFDLNGPLVNPGPGDSPSPTPFYSSIKILFLTEERIEKRGRGGLDGRVWGHWSVRRGAFGVPAKREGARSQWR